MSPSKVTVLRARFEPEVKVTPHDVSVPAEPELRVVDTPGEQDLQRLFTEFKLRTGSHPDIDLAHLRRWSEGPSDGFIASLETGNFISRFHRHTEESGQIALPLYSQSDSLLKDLSTVSATGKSSRDALRMLAHNVHTIMHDHPEIWDDIEPQVNRAVAGYTPYSLD
jgi:hypothetical protein